MNIIVIETKMYTYTIRNMKQELQIIQCDDNILSIPHIRKTLNISDDYQFVTKHGKLLTDNDFVTANNISVLLYVIPKHIITDDH